MALLALYNFYTRSSSVNYSAESQTKEPPSIPTPIRKYWFPDALALGSLIYSLHSLLNDSSTIITWSWTGYPITGPLPHLYGSLTHLAQVVGLLLPLAISSLAPTLHLFSHPLWFAYGSISMYVMYAYSDWLGYIGGLNVAVFLMSIIPMVLMRAATSGSLAKTYFGAMLVVCLFDVFGTFTVAYAFVPFGGIFRERTSQ